MHSVFSLDFFHFSTTPRKPLIAIWLNFSRDFRRTCFKQLATLADSVLLFWLHVAPAGHCKEYCHNDEFRAVCTSHSVILMTNALYGRMTIGPCVKTDFGFVGCSRDVITHLHQRCSGRQECSVRVPDASLDMTDPCNQDLKSYLDASFICVPGRYQFTQQVMRGYLFDSGSFCKRN